jgi:hypothetical protein
MHENSSATEDVTTLQASARPFKQTVTTEIKRVQIGKCLVTGTNLYHSVMATRI